LAVADELALVVRCLNCRMPHSNRSLALRPIIPVGPFR
jgi:hypothetical protein